MTPLSDEDLALLLLIRHFETRLLGLFAEGSLHGTTHTCLGQEHVPVALRTLVGDDDFVFSNHRGHGHYLARFDDPTGLLAEIMGREGAICNGVGGSQHLYRQRFLSSGIQGQSVPVAAGTALHLRRTGSRGLSVVFVGDGTWGQGVVYEALNIASLWRLPLLMIVENNGIAMSTPIGAHLAGTIGARAAAFGLQYVYVDSVDVNVIRGRLAPLVAAARADREPLVVEFRTTRLGPHSRGDDTRDPRQLAQAREQDWAARYAARFPEQFARLDRQQRERMAAVVQEVASYPPASWEGV